MLGRDREPTDLAPLNVGGRSGRRGGALRILRPAKASDPTPERLRGLSRAKALRGRSRTGEPSQSRYDLCATAGIRRLGERADARRLGERAGLGQSASATRTSWPSRRSGTGVSWRPSPSTDRPARGRKNDLAQAGQASTPSLRGPAASEPPQEAQASR
jgi:hypothetical protein